MKQRYGTKIAGLKKNYIMYELLEFVFIIIATYAFTAGFYLVFGFAVLTVVKRHPERRIQKNRDGLIRARREIIQSLWGLISTSLFFGAAIYIQRNNLGLFPVAELTWISAPFWFLGLLIFYDTWFYWQHRLMHTKLFYRYHQIHHKSVATTVWSSESNHWIDDAAVKVFFTLAAFLTPVPMAILIAVRILDMAKSTIGHCGHELVATPLTRKPLPFLCTTFHDKHHSHFTVNFSNSFTIWDRICGTLASDYDEQVKQWEVLEKDERNNSSC